MVFLSELLSRGLLFICMSGVVFLAVKIGSTLRKASNEKKLSEKDSEKN